MKNRLVYISLLVLVVISCNKDKLDSTPSIKIHSISSTDIPLNGSMDVELEFADKEGDISDTLFLYKYRLNQKVVATLNRDTIDLQVPEFPGKPRGFIKLNLSYDYLIVTNSNDPDSMIMKFVLRDQAKHRSDTASTGLIIVHK